MTDLDSSSNGGYPHEVFVIEDKSDDLGNCGNNSTNSQLPPAPSLGDGQVPLITPPIGDDLPYPFGWQVKVHRWLSTDKYCSCVSGSAGEGSGGPLIRGRRLIHDASSQHR